MRDIGVGTTCRSKDQTDIWATLAFLWRERENIQSSVSVFKNGWLRTSLGLNKHVKKKKKKVRQRTVYVLIYCLILVHVNAKQERHTL